MTLRGAVNEAPDSFPVAGRSRRRPTLTQLSRLGQTHSESSHAPPSLRTYFWPASAQHHICLCYYLLHTGLKGTLYRGRNYYFEMSRRGSLCYSREMIKKHVRNKPNSHFQKSYACSTKSMLAVVGRTISCQFEISKTRSVPTPKATGRIALMMLGTSKMDSPASN